MLNKYKFLQILSIAALLSTISAAGADADSIQLPPVEKHIMPSVIGGFDLTINAVSGVSVGASVFVSRLLLNGRGYSFRLRLSPATSLNLPPDYNQA